jgi:hypothetical protein
LFLIISALALRAISNMSSGVVIPPGGTWLDTVRKSFVDVPIDASQDNGISTTEFLEASESLATLFGKRGRKSFVNTLNIAF